MAIYDPADLLTRRNTPHLAVPVFILLILGTRRACCRLSLQQTSPQGDCTASPIASSRCPKTTPTWQNSAPHTLDNLTHGIDNKYRNTPGLILENIDPSIEDILRRQRILLSRETVSQHSLRTRYLELCSTSHLHQAKTTEQSINHGL